MGLNFSSATAVKIFNLEITRLTVHALEGPILYEDWSYAYQCPLQSVAIFRDWLFSSTMKNVIIH